MYKIFIVLGVCLLATITFILFNVLRPSEHSVSSTPRGDVVDNTIDASGIEKNRMAIAALNKKIGKLENQPATGHDEIELSTSDVNTGNQIDEKDSEQELQEALVQIEKTYQGLKTSLENEEIDGQWSEESEKKIFSVLDSEIFSEVGIESVECRTGLCEITMAHPNMEVYDKFSNSNFIFQMYEDKRFHAAWSKVDKESLDNGEPKVTMFLVRAGHLNNYSFQ